MKTITVLLCDDHDIVRQGLRALLEVAGDMLVIGEAENGHQAVRETKRLQPEVVVMDLAMPLLNGVEAARQIAHQAPDVRVLILSSYNDDEHLHSAVEAGAAGYLMKESAGDELLAAVRETHNGGAFFSPHMLKRMLKKRFQRAPDDVAPTENVRLTYRQGEVLQLIAEGYASKQIAAVLSVSVKTIEKHRQGLMNTLDIHNIASLTRYAISRGVIESNLSPIGQSGQTGEARILKNAS